MYKRSADKRVVSEPKEKNLGVDLFSGSDVREGMAGLEEEREGAVVGFDSV